MKKNLKILNHVFAYWKIKMSMINKFFILLLNIKINKDYSYFLAGAFRNIISFSMLYHITKFRFIS